MINHNLISEIQMTFPKDVADHHKADLHQKCAYLVAQFKSKDLALWKKFSEELKTLKVEDSWDYFHMLLVEYQKLADKPDLKKAPETKPAAPAKKKEVKAPAKKEVKAAAPEKKEAKKAPAKKAAKKVAKKAPAKKAPAKKVAAKKPKAAPAPAKKVLAKKAVKKAPAKKVAKKAKKK